MNEFLDEYKHLEKLCSEIFNQNHGVTLYIDEMANTPRHVAISIPGWSRDLDYLKRVRYIRNAMSHDTSYNEDDYHPEDVEFMRNFHERILNQQDPLSLLRIQSEVASVHQAKPATEHPLKIESNVPSLKGTKPSSNDHSAPSDNDEWSTAKFIIVFIITMAIITALGWMGFHIFL